MIVRDEAPVVARCLHSVRDHIDSWVVCDTGSVDATIAIVEAELAGIPGELHRHEWAGFAPNRTAAVELARRNADYVLVVDADMTVNVAGDYRADLSADAYLIRYEGPIEYYQAMLLGARRRWRFVGATHEYVTSDEPFVFGALPAVSLTHHCDGASRREKLTRDIDLLTEAAVREPSDSRTAFYLAQTLHDAGQLDGAVDWYERRAEMGGWDEEIWYSLYQLARIAQHRREPTRRVITAYRRAHDHRSSRLETVPALARTLRAAGRADEAYELTRDASARTKPGDILFVELDPYICGVPLEHAENCAATGRWAEALETVVELLDGVHLDCERQRDVIRLQSRCLRALFPPVVDPDLRPRSITVLLPFYNPGPFLAAAVESLTMQDYDSFRVVACDDASTDGSAAAIPRDDPRFTLVTNRRNSGGGLVMHRLISEHCDSDDIVVQLDGDDRLSAADTLSEVNRQYAEQNCWVLYGQYQTSSGAYGTSRPFPDRRSFDRLRTRHAISHLRTFRAGLYHRIGEQNPGYSCMKDDAGAFVRVAMDVAIMNPLAELAGFDRVRFNDRVLYTYNVDNPRSVFRIDPDGERAMADLLRARTPLEQVTSYR